MDQQKHEKKQIHIILLGASIGRAWNFTSLPERIKTQKYSFEYIDFGGFDKSEKLKEIIARKENNPNAIFLKECAAYFPADLEDYKSLMKQWIKECHEANIIPIPATVVPVTRLHYYKKFLIDILKRRNPFKMGSPIQNRRIKSILLYNDWIRSYCKENDLAILDLEEAVHYSEKNRYLREDYATIDGLHLNSRAYEILDQIVIPILEKINWAYKNVGEKD